MPGRRKGLLDRALAAVGLQRRAPVRQRAYAGAQVNRLTADWVGALLSADNELRQDLKLLRGRSRELVRDHPHAAQYLRLLRNNVSGPNGVRLQAQLRGTDDELLRDVNRGIEDAWRRWGRPGSPTLDGRHSWLSLERLVDGLVAMDGEALLRFYVVPKARNAFAFMLQVLDPDQLDERFNRGPDANGVRISMGVELDRYGRPLAYHVWSAHPQDTYTTGRRERIRVPAAEMLHLFVPFRPGQTRGVPWFAPVLLRLRMLDGYDEAEIVAARLAAAKQGFIVTDPEHADGYQAPAEGETTLTMDAEPGQLHELAPGQTFAGWDPEHPTTAYEPFTGACQRAIAAGVGASYMSLTGDLRGTSYSSGRIGLLQERDEFLALQSWITEAFHTPVYLAWLRYAALAGQVALPSFEADRWTAHRWQGRGWPWVDPLKDAQASGLEVRLGVNSRTAICAERGLDFEEVLEQLAEEQSLAASYGVTLSTDVGKPVTDKADKEEDDEPDAGAAAGGDRHAAGVSARGDTRAPLFRRRFGLTR